VRKGRVSNAECPKLTRPQRISKLIAHGRQDDVISFRHGEILFSVAAEPKEFLPFEGSHNDDVFVTSPAYRDELKVFFNKL